MSEPPRQTFILPKTDWPEGHQFNILIGAEAVHNAQAFFHSSPDTFLLEVRSGTEWDELLEGLGLIGESGVFPSRKVAREYGWKGEIPEGWSDKTVGKKKIRICVLRMEENANEYDEDQLGEAGESRGLPDPGTPVRGGVRKPEGGDVHGRGAGHDSDPGG